MHIDFLLEEESAARVLAHLLPSVLPENTTFSFHPFQGKQDLLKKLPARMKGYQWLLRHENRTVVVLVDADEQDCKELKQTLESAARDAGLSTASSAAGSQRVHVLNRIAVKELEAWFFGDCEAIVNAFPGVPSTLSRKSGFRDPDAIKGGTAVALERVLQKAGYYTSGMPKIAVADQIASCMVIDRNASRSFDVFVQGLKRISI